MKLQLLKTYFKLLLAISMLAIPCNLRAQEDEEDPGTGFEGGGDVEEPAAPIDSHIVWLAAAGIGLICCKSKNDKSTTGMR